MIAELTDEQAKKADLGVGKLFLAPIGKIETEKMLKHYCNNCETEFDNPPKIQLEESPNEEVADNLVLVERGQYICEKCSSIIGEYRGKIFSTPTPLATLLTVKVAPASEPCFLASTNPSKPCSRVFPFS